MRSEEREKLLTHTELALIVLSVLPIFFFQAGPVWQHPYQIDAAVYWSYAPIPLLVAAALLRRHVLSLAGFLVNTITALSVKYLITTSVAFLLWAIFEPPVLAHTPLPSPEHSVKLDDPAPHPPVELALTLRSLDGSLHTVRAGREDGSIAFNLPVIPGRTSKPIALNAMHGTLELSCAVHPDEAHTTIIVP